MSPNDVFATVPGAVVDDGVLVHVGDMFGEQRALADGRAVAPRGDRTVLAVDGADRRGWLDALGTQTLAGLAPGIGTETLVLDVRGHVRWAASVIDDGTTTWLIVDRSGADGLQEWLASQREGHDVRVRDARADLIVVGGTTAAVRAVGAVVADGIPLIWRDPWPGGTPERDGAVRPGTASTHAVPADRVATHPAAGWDWAEALVSAARAETLAWKAQSGSVRLAGALAADALRIAAWRPRGDDVDDRTTPRDLDWTRITGRAPHAADPPRRLVALQLDGSESILPARGDAVRLGDAVVGRVRAAAVHYEDGPIALALLDGAAPVDVDLVVAAEQGSVAAAQEPVTPLPDPRP